MGAGGFLEKLSSLLGHLSDDLSAGDGRLKYQL